MTFSIDTTGIDVEFPRPNKNNNSQQFRDNFNFIKSGLDSIAEKVSTMDETVALKADTALIGEFVSNDGKLFLDAVNCGHVRNADAITSTHALDYSHGEYQIFRIDSDCTFDLSIWPNNLYGKVRLELRNNQIDSEGYRTESVVTFTCDSGVIKAGTGLLPLVLSSSRDIITIIDVWSPDTGVTVFVSLIGYFS